MKVKYVGRQQTPRVVTAGDREYVTDEDNVVEVPDDLGERLIEQDIWEKIDDIGLPQLNEGDTH